MHEKVRKI